MNTPKQEAFEDAIRRVFSADTLEELGTGLTDAYREFRGMDAPEQAMNIIPISFAFHRAGTTMYEFEHGGDE